MKQIKNLISQMIVKSVSAMMFVLMCSGADKIFLHLDFNPFTWFIIFTVIYFLLKDEKLDD